MDVVDVVVIGAGISGLYAVHKFRNQLGLSVQAFDAADDVGGTWFWNKYPGARCDIESVHYSYSFSDEIQREWQWSEKYASQPEILAYLQFVADKLDLRRSYRFGTRITSLEWQEAAARWLVSSDDGRPILARHVVSAVGGLSQRADPGFPGIDVFEGELYWTSSWPDRKIDFSNKRVAVVGTGSSGIQVVQELAHQVRQLTVFQRTPNYAVPLGNAPVDPAQRRWNAENWRTVRANVKASVAGMPFPKGLPSAFSVDANQRKRIYDEAYERGGMRFFLSTFDDLMWNPDANETISSYVREQIRRRVADPEKAEMLVPSDHPYGTKRPPFEMGYYEAFNLPHVDLVDVRTSPIQEITRTGIRTKDASYEFDAIILATGFDAFTGALLAMQVTGRNGLTLKQKWSSGPRNYLGLQMAGFPNLFTIGGPVSITSQYNQPLLSEANVDFVASAVQAVEDRFASTIEPTIEAEEIWVSLVDAVYTKSIWAKARNSWLRGSNIPGKPEGAYFFPVGGPLYWENCRQVLRGGLAGFAVDGNGADVPPLLRLDAEATLALAAQLNSGAEPVDGDRLLHRVAS